jgi:hypothetical protein
MAPACLGDDDRNCLRLLLSHPNHQGSANDNHVGPRPTSSTALARIRSRLPTAMKSNYLVSFLLKFQDLRVENLARGREQRARSARREACGQCRGPLANSIERSCARRSSSQVTIGTLQMTSFRRIDGSVGTTNFMFTIARRDRNSGPPASLPTNVFVWIWTAV